MCSVVFHAFTLRLPIQTSLSVAPKLPVFARLGGKCQTFRKTSTPLHTFFDLNKDRLNFLQGDFIGNPYELRFSSFVLENKSNSTNWTTKILKSKDFCEV